ncbi:MAG: hypothetical protein CMO16_03755 [Thaumarchaeota archaeon]|nr:hypothetical protein [Nitrososphaerota archaeon]
MFLGHYTQKKGKKHNNRITYHIIYMLERARSARRCERVGNERDAERAGSERYGSELEASEIKSELETSEHYLAGQR